jgi:hypothetical protein
MPEKQITFSVRHSPGGGYEARAVGHSIFTQAETMDELKLNAAEAVRTFCQPPPEIRLVEARPATGGWVRLRAN